MTSNRVSPFENLVNFAIKIIYKPNQINSVILRHLYGLSNYDYMQEITFRSILLNSEAVTSWDVFNYLIRTNRSFEIVEIKHLR